MPYLRYVNSDKEVYFEKGKTLLSALLDDGQQMDTPCNGKGKCGKCRVKIVEGVLPEPTEAELKLLSKEDLAAGIRLACMVYPEGDITVEANASETGYYVMLFVSRDDNHYNLANVRHILVNFEGGTTDENGNTTYSDEEKAAALEEAENLLTLYEMGEQTEEAFADLATANTDDTGSAETGGLYEDIAPVQGVYVESFTNWATDPAREAGDTGIIESTYGYHVMYYVGDDEMTYRDSMIFDEIQSETISTWYDGILSTGKVEEKDTSYLNKDIVLAQ